MGKLRSYACRFGSVSPAARAGFRAHSRPDRGQEGGWRSVARASTPSVGADWEWQDAGGFFWCIDQLANEAVPAEAERCAFSTFSPLKA